VKLISTRPNATKDFWWTSNEASIKALRDSVVALANQMNIPNDVTVSPDGLTCTATYTVDSEQTWQNFVTALASNVPTLVATRNAYYASNGHKLTLEVSNAETNEVLRVINVVA